jgi:uncharacterized protein
VIQWRLRAVAQFGSALDWGSSGRRFKSCQPDKRSRIFEISEDHAGKYRFHLKAPNGEIIAASQGYETKANAEQGIEAIETHAPNAKTEPQRNLEPIAAHVEKRITQRVSHWDLVPSGHSRVVHARSPHRGRHGSPGRESRSSAATKTGYSNTVAPESDS